RPGDGLCPADLGDRRPARPRAPGRRPGGRGARDLPRRRRGPRPPPAPHPRSPARREPARLSAGRPPPRGGRRARHHRLTPPGGRMTDVESLKSRVVETVDGLAEELWELALRIHANPELAYREEKAAGWLSDFLEKRGC